MPETPRTLPSDPDELRAAAEQLRDLAKSQALKIEKLEHQLAGHRKARFGSKSESLDQLAFDLSEDRVQRGKQDEKGRILTEFAEISGYHRKHAEQLLRRGHVVDRSRSRPGRRIYDDAVREALVVARPCCFASSFC